MEEKVDLEKLRGGSIKELCDDKAPPSIWGRVPETTEHSPQQLCGTNKARQWAQNRIDREGIRSFKVSLSVTEFAYVVLAVMDKNACRYSFALTGQVDEDENGVLSHGSGA